MLVERTGQKTPTFSTPGGVVSKCLLINLHSSPPNVHPQLNPHTYIYYVQNKNQSSFSYMGMEGGRKGSRSENISLFPTEKLFCVLFDISCLFFQLMPMYDYYIYLHSQSALYPVVLFRFFLCCEFVNVKVYKTAMMMLMRISTNISSVFAIYLLYVHIKLATFIYTPPIQPPFCSYFIKKLLNVHIS